MFRFRIGSIPVEVRGSHLLVAGLLAWSWMPGAHAPDQSRAFAAILAGALVVFVSVLVHELGHALVAVAYGYRPAIVIESFGGHTFPNAPVPMTWLREVLLTFAGPFFGFCLGVGSAIALVAVSGVPLLAALRMGAEAPLPVQLLAFLTEANFAWAALNLIPVMPLDGGRISHAIFTRLLGRHGVLFSQGLSLLLCAAGAYFGLANGNPILTVFFAMWGYRSLQILSAYFRRSDPAHPPHPSDLAYAQAAALFEQQKFAEARELAENALHSTPPPPPPTCARLHHLLGWIAVKEGDGNAALDHFSRLGRHEVEPQALAAALSLSGDDERALPLWELAYRSTRDRSVANEWAGTLIRLGRTDDAAKVPGVNLKEAWRAAERLAYLRKDYERAAALGARALELYPSPELAYDSACSFARTGRLGEAQALLDRAASLGFTNAAHALNDPDLAALRQTPAFSDWLRRLQESARP